MPVQVIVNTEDRWVRPHGYDDEARWVPRLWRRDIKAGHWSPFSHPQVLAGSVAELVDVTEGRPPSRAMRRAQVGKPREPFSDMLVSVTGAGSGIGRATAIEFARQGAEVVASDVDEASVRETAKSIAAQGGIAHAYTLDVSDADAVEAFADEVCNEHGVPDIVVNNAGVGQAGRFIDTPAQEWDRVLDINLGGVVNCCRAFARRLVERGTGGHIVNVASAAAFAPLQSLNAYCTSKAAVYMFSDCLRAELDAAGIGLTTVCPGPVHTNIVNTARFNAPPGKASQASATAQAMGKAVRRPAIRPGEGREGDRVGGSEEQADASGDARGLPALRHLTARAAGAAQHRPRTGDVAQPLAAQTVYPFVAMSSRTANIVRVGTPVPPLPV